jgi:hypothetical protein
MEEDIQKLHPDNPGDGYNIDYFYNTRNLADHIDRLRSFLVDLRKMGNDNPDTPWEELYIELDYPNTGVGEAVHMIQMLCEGYNSPEGVKEILTELGDAFVSCDHDRIEEAIENMFRIKDKLIPIKDEFNRRSKGLLGTVKKSEGCETVEHGSAGGDTQRSRTDEDIDRQLAEFTSERSRKVAISTQANRRKDEFRKLLHQRLLVYENAQAVLRGRDEGHSGQGDTAGEEDEQKTTE